MPIIELLNMDKALVSIGMPTVKSLYLKGSIESCLKQTYINIEIIILNNANKSTEKKAIKDIALSFNDKRIKYYENDIQIPMVQNWNKTLELSKGDFFSILCDDDLWHPRFIEELVLLSKKYPNVCIFHSRVLIVDENGKKKDITQLCPEYETGLDFIYHKLINQRRDYLSDFLLRTNELKNIGGFFLSPSGWGSDTVTWYKLAMLGGIAYSAEKLFLYRHNAQNTTSNISVEDKKNANKNIINEIKNIIVNYNFDDKFYREIILEKLKHYEAELFSGILVQKLKSNYRIPHKFAKLVSLVYKNNLIKK